MKFEEMYVSFEDINERNSIVAMLESNGYKLDDSYSSKKKNHIAIYTNGVFWESDKTDSYSPVLTYKQFMEKYAMTELQKAIEAAKKQGYTNKTLSNALGKYDGYIARIISKPQSEKLQKELVKNINELLVPATIDDAMMISKEEYNTLTSIKCEKERIEREYSEFQVERDSYVKQFNHDIEKLEKELDHKNQVLDKRNDKYNLLEGEFNKLTQDKEGLIRTINELEQQNKRVVDSNFELNDVISVRDARISDLENDYSMRSSMHITSENKRKKERFWFAGITVALLVLFVISHLA